MRELLSFLVLACVLISGRAFAADPADPCGHCAGKEMEPIHVHLVSADQTEPGWRNLEFMFSGDKLRDKYHKKVCPTCKTVQLTALGGNSFADAIKSAAANCQQIKLMTVISHGNRGLVALGPSKGKGYLTSSGVRSGVPASLSCAIAPDATIHFDGCNVSRGCRGEGFVTLLAGRLLPKGGTIQACDYYSYASGIMADICPLPHSLHVEAGLKNAKWRGLISPATAGECKDNIKRDYAVLKELLDQKGSCAEKKTRDIAGWADDFLKRSIALEDKIGDNRTVFTDDQATEAETLEHGYDDLNIAAAQLRKTPECPLVGSADAPSGCRSPSATPESGYVRTLKALWKGIRSKI